jgi:hypothetical protein
MTYFFSMREDGRKTVDELPFVDFAQAIEHLSRYYRPRSSRSVLVFSSEVINGALARCYRSLVRPESVVRDDTTHERLYERAVETDRAFQYDRSYLFVIETEIGAEERRRNLGLPPLPVAGADAGTLVGSEAYHVTVLADGAPLAVRETFDDYARAIGFVSRYYRPTSGRSVLTFDTEVIEGRFARAHVALNRPEALDERDPEFARLYPVAAVHSNAFAYDRSYRFLVESDFGIAESERHAT